jgi:HAMP domain-containing protein
MDWATVATTAATSAVISAVVSGSFARWTSERTIQIENITKERAKWRDKIREQVE